MFEAAKVKKWEDILSINGNHVDSDGDIVLTSGGFFFASSRKYEGNTYNIVNENNETIYLDVNGTEVGFRRELLDVTDMSAKLHATFRGLPYVMYLSVSSETVSEVVSYGIEHGYKLEKTHFNDGKILIEMSKTRTDCEIR